MSDLIQVQFKSKYADSYGGRPYTYRTESPMNVGDVVTVPTRSGNSEARVCRVDVPESELDSFVRDKLLTVTAPATVGSLFDEFF